MKTDFSQIENRHLRNKDDAVWFNMFETISNNYCLSQAKIAAPKLRVTPSLSKPKVPRLDM